MQQKKKLARQLSQTAHADQAGCGGCLPCCLWQTSSASNDTATPLQSRSTSTTSVTSTAAPLQVADAPAPPPTLNEIVKRFHYTLRWAKPWEEIEKAAAGMDLKTLSCERDPVNGNAAIHIAAQNGHLDLVRKLIAGGAAVNAQNNKGLTALHMSAEYDFYFVSRLLLDSGAESHIMNEAGSKAINGIDGGKTGEESWDNPVTVLKAATTQEQLEIAFVLLDKALDTPEHVSKERLIQTGLLKKKSPDTQEIWDHKRFLLLAAKF